MKVVVFSKADHVVRLAIGDLMNELPKVVVVCNKEYQGCGIYRYELSCCDEVSGEQVVEQHERLMFHIAHMSKAFRFNIDVYLYEFFNESIKEFHPRYNQEGYEYRADN